MPDATSTDWPESSVPLSGSFTCAFAPTVALVFTVMMSTVPETATPTVAATAAATPTAATSSLFVAVTATPLKSSDVPAVTVRGPDSEGSADGMLPDATRLWPWPVACDLSSVMKMPWSASSFVLASLKAPGLDPTT